MDVVYLSLLPDGVHPVRQHDRGLFVDGDIVFPTTDHLETKIFHNETPKTVLNNISRAEFGTSDLEIALETFKSCIKCK